MPARRRRVRWSVLVAMICLVIDAAPAHAQVAAGELTGIVKDQAGTAVPGAAVIVTNIATDLQRVVSTNDTGVYTVAGLPPGEYRIDVELAHFRAVRRSAVRLTNGEKARVDFALPGRGPPRQ